MGFSGGKFATCYCQFRTLKLIEKCLCRCISLFISASSVSSRRSSLISISSNGSSTMATSVTSGMSRSPSSAYPQSPDLIPPIDPIAIVEIENQARLVADSLDLMMGNLRNNLHKVSTVSYFLRYICFPSFLAIVVTLASASALVSASASRLDVLVKVFKDPYLLNL